MRGMVVGILMIAAGAVQAQTVEQRQFIDQSIRAYLIVDRCTNLQVDNVVLAKEAVRFGVSADDISRGGRFATAVNAAENAARPSIADVTQSALCNQIWRTLYGQDGVFIPNLLSERPVQPFRPAREVAPLTKVQTATEPKPRVVAGVDMQLAPRKWMGQPVEMRRMRCLHADKDEYRCITSDSSTLIIFAEAIKPAAMQDFMERSCGTFEEMMKPTCRFTLRFTASEHGSDTISGYQKRTVIRAATVEAIREPVRRN